MVGSTLPNEQHRSFSGEPAALRQRVTELEQELAALQREPALPAQLEQTEPRRPGLNQRESEEIYRAMFEKNRSVKLLIDPQNGAIIDANPAACQFYGYERSVMQTMFITDVNTLPSEEIFAAMGRVIAQERSTFLFRHRLASGEVRDVEVHATLVEVQRRQLLFSIVYDISDRARHEREREAIITVAAALRTATTRADLVPILLSQVASLLKAEGVALVVPSPSSGGGVVEQGIGIYEPMTGRQILAEEGGFGQVMTIHEPDLTRAASPDSSPLPSAASAPVETAVCIPLVAQEESIGTLCIGCQHPITETELQTLSAIGNMAANALHRATLHEQTERRLQHIQALHTIDQAITTSLNLRVTLNVLIFQVTTQLAIDAAAVLLLNANTQTLDYSAGRGFLSLAIQQTSLRLGEGLAGQVAMGQEFVHIPDIHQTDAEAETCERSLLEREGFVTYYGVPLIARGRVKGVLELFHRSMLIPDQEWLEFLGTLAGQASIAIDNADMFAQLQRSNMELSRAYDATIEGWARALELRDAETEGHCRRVTDLTLKLARRMGFGDEDMVYIRRGTILHDIGKMAIPDAILLKRGPLTKEERAIMQQHTLYAYQLLSPIPFLRSSLDIPYCHHEKWNGTGYPRRLKGEDIPLIARIFAVVDVWDALCFDRPYRRSWKKCQVCDYIRERAGTEFDPQVVEVFLQMVREQEEEEARNAGIGPTSDTIGYRSRDPCD
ncbi:MAG: GAF domain-containing protein [Chloroflexaceae bacterium]|nr:GAF domain-containing protein [Chloroflexaceae bacterium]